MFKLNRQKIRQALRQYKETLHHGTTKEREKAAITLIKAMTENIKEWENINPLDIYKTETFKKLLNLAERV